MGGESTVSRMVAVVRVGSVETNPVENHSRGLTHNQQKCLG